MCKWSGAISALILIAVGLFGARHCNAQVSIDLRRLEGEELSRAQHAYEITTLLLDDAVANKNSELTIAQLRITKATLAIKCGKADTDVRSALDDLGPILVDASPFLHDHKSALLFVQAVSLYGSLLSKDSFTELLNRSIDEVETAMGAVERERFLTIASLRLVGAETTLAQGAPKESVNWLAPLTAQVERLVEDEPGCEILVKAIFQLLKPQRELKRGGELLAIMQRSIEQLAQSSLSEPKKICFIGALRSEQVSLVSESPDSLSVQFALDGAQLHLSQVASYQGADAIVVQNSGLELRFAMLNYYSKRDPEEMVRLVESTFDEVVLHPGLCSDFRGGFTVMKIWSIAVGDATDQPAQLSRERLISFVDKLDEVGARGTFVDAMKQRAARLR